MPGVAPGIDAASTADPADRQRFWSAYQPGFRFTDAPVGSPSSSATSRHIATRSSRISRRSRASGDWADRDVLEGGCGIATDGLQFARNGARYTGVDFSPDRARPCPPRFALEGVDGRFVQGSG